MSFSLHKAGGKGPSDFPKAVWAVNILRMDSASGGLVNPFDIRWASCLEKSQLLSPPILWNEKLKQKSKSQRVKE